MANVEPQQRSWSALGYITLVATAKRESVMSSSAFAYRTRRMFVALFLSAFPLSAAEPVAVTRSAGGYRVTLTLTDTEPRGISSIAVQRGKERFTLPASLFDDIRAPHLGAGFKAAEFRFETKRDKAFIRIVAGDRAYPDDHAWILSLPLKDASRISRVGDTTGYKETRPSTPLVPQPSRRDVVD